MITYQLASETGVFGVVDECFDIELLRNVAHLCPECKFAIIGQAVKSDPNYLPQAQKYSFFWFKIIYVSIFVYRSLAYSFDSIAINESTEFINPRKTSEYLAARRPVISTAKTSGLFRSQE